MSLDRQFDPLAASIDDVKQLFSGAGNQHVVLEQCASAIFGSLANRNGSIKGLLIE